MKMKILLISLFATAVLTLTGCAEEEGAMEKAGKSLDSAAEKVEDTAKEVSEDVKDAVNE